MGVRLAAVAIDQSAFLRDNQRARKRQTHERAHQRGNPHTRTRSVRDSERAHLTNAPKTSSKFFGGLLVYCLLFLLGCSVKFPGWTYAPLLPPERD